jgi:hypothetical protein
MKRPPSPQSATFISKRINEINVKIDKEITNKDFKNDFKKVFIV